MYVTYEVNFSIVALNILVHKNHHYEPFFAGDPQLFPDKF
jgi:hypothetical protein